MINHIAVPVVFRVPCLRYLETKYPKNRKGWSDDAKVNTKIHTVLDWAATELHRY